MSNKAKAVAIQENISNGKDKLQKRLLDMQIDGRAI